MDIEFPRKLRPLFDPQYDAYVIYGGRDGTKSWGVARALLEMGTQAPERILCARETQQSIQESVHQLLEDQIKQMNMGHLYNVQKKTIIGIGAAAGTEFFFAGLKHNVDGIKSYERITKIWVEEAQSVSKHSWDVVLPTIRTEGAKIYVTYNPELSTDNTHVRWVLNPPPNTWVQKIGWEDNRWLSRISIARIEHMRATDPIGFAHVYGGECKSSVVGAIFKNEMAAALADGRIGQVPYNKALPVQTAWDLGFGDLNTIWFLQPYDGWYNFIDYAQGRGLTIADWIVTLQTKGYVYGTDWMPHDAIDAIIHHKLSGTGDRTMSIEQLARAAGRKVRIVPKLLITDRINAARTIFSRCRFDQEKCADGLQALRHYQWEGDTCSECQGTGKLQGTTCPICHGTGQADPEKKKKKEPLHNWASHGADGFQAAAVAIKAPPEKEERPTPPPRLRPQTYIPFG